MTQFQTWWLSCFLQFHFQSTTSGCRNMGIFGGMLFVWSVFPSLWRLLHSFYGVIVTREELQGMPCSTPMTFIRQWGCLWIRELARNGALTVKVTLQWKQYKWTLWKYFMWKKRLKAWWNIIINLIIETTQTCEQFHQCRWVWCTILVIVNWSFQ